MSSFGGLMKLQSYWNRVQQKRDWQMILNLTKKEINPPDWTKSVKKIDAYMETVCKENGLDHMKIFCYG